MPTKLKGCSSLFVAKALKRIGKLCSMHRKRAPAPAGSPALKPVVLSRSWCHFSGSLVASIHSSSPSSHKTWCRPFSALYAKILPWCIWLLPATQYVSVLGYTFLDSNCPLVAPHLCTGNGIITV